MNYQEIIDNLKEEDIKNLLDKLGIPYQDKGNYLICKTGCHNTDIENASWKLYYYKDNHFFYCYSECQGMSIFKFLKTYYETRNIEYDWYEDIYNVVLNCSTYKFKEGFESSYKSLKDVFSPRTSVKELEIYPEGVLDVFIKYYPTEWLNDGISKEAMDKFNIRFSISQNKIIIPHYDEFGRLVGIRGRALNEWEVENFGKYMPLLIEKTWYKHPLSLNLYGLNKTKENIKKYGICFVGEAEKFVLQMDGFNMPNCSVAVCGSQFNKFQLTKLIKICMPKEICICFDQEEKAGKDEYFFKLYNICKKYVNYCNMSFIYDRDGLLGLKDSPTDRGEEVFRKLLKKRIVVR